MPSPARIRSTIAAIVIQPDDLRQLRAFHKVLADVNRLRIVRRLAEGEATVTELIEHVGLSPAARRRGTSAACAPPASSRRGASAARRSAACARRPSASSPRASAPSSASRADADR